MYFCYKRRAIDICVPGNYVAICLEAESSFRLEAFNSVSFLIAACRLNGMVSMIDISTAIIN